MNISTLYKEFGSGLKFFIAKRINDTAMVDDLFHEVFIKIHNNISSLRDNKKVESWIYQITRNTINDYYRKSRNPISVELEEIPAFDNCDDEVHKKISLGLKEFIDQLPDIYKEAILLTEFEGMTQRQLAEKLGISLTGAKSRVQRARKILRNLLMECCHFEFDKYGTILDYYDNPSYCCCTKHRKIS